MKARGSFDDFAAKKLEEHERKMKAAAEEKRKRDKLAAVEQQRRWAVAAEREGTYGRSAHSWQAQRDAVAAEKDATDTIVWALSHAEKLVVKTLKKQRRSLLECESTGRVDAMNKGRMGAECRGVVTGAVFVLVHVLHR